MTFYKVAAHLAVAVAKVTMYWGRWTPNRRSQETARWSEQTLSIFGLRVVAKGAMVCPHSPALLVANHISWLDVFVLLSRLDCVFVAKDDVRRWPICGWLAERIGTIFTPRRSVRALEDRVSSVAGALMSGRSVVVFPEGTSTDGCTLLPFKPAMFEAAIRASVPVQPVAIRYLDSFGRWEPLTAFVGEMSLLTSLCRLARIQRSRAEIIFLPAHASFDETRSTLAKKTEAEIRYALWPEEG